MKMVYICHPLANDEIGNRELVREICKNIANTEEVCPIAVHLALSYLDESTQRALAMDFCLNILEMCDELWQYGKPSAGMQIEIERANALMIPVVQKGEDS